MPDNFLIIVFAWLVWNVIVFLVYASDKRRAIRKQWRIPESTLIVLAWAGGGLCALLGMVMLRHKTRHWKFRLLVPLALIMQVLILFCQLSIF